MKTFNILGRDVVISDEREAYNELRLLFQKEAVEAEKRFKALYQKNTSIEDVIKNVPGQIDEAMRPSLELCIQKLIEHEIYTIDVNQLLEDFPKITDFWYKHYEEICDSYAEIVLREEELDEYRAARRAGRARWSGGGFGIGGAIKGAATAGVLNAVSGAGHMLVNGIGKIASSISASWKKDSLFKDPDTYGNLAFGVNVATSSIHLALVEMLSKTGVKLQRVTYKDADAILNNAKLMTDDEQCRTAMLRSLELNPYTGSWYRYALERFGDSDGTLESVCSYFGLDTVRVAKEDLLESFAQSLPISTEIEAISAAEEVRKYKKHIHFSEDTPQTTVIAEAVARFDEEYRTVDGILLPTRDEVDVAKKELSEITEIENGIDHENLASIADGIQKMDTFSSVVATKHKEALQQEWAELEADMRTADTFLPGDIGILFETVEEAAYWENVARGLAERLKECGRKGEEAEQKLLAFKTQILGESISAPLLDCYIKEIDSRLAAIDVALRTTLGKEYPTREAARKAEAEHRSIEAELQTGNPKKNGDKVREHIKSADLSEDAKRKLASDLFQKENVGVLKAAAIISAISLILFAVISVVGFLMRLSGTETFAYRNITTWGVSEVMINMQVKETLSFADGFINGFVVFGKSLGNFLINGYNEYINGFDYSWGGNILWAILGFIWVFIKHAVLFVPKYFYSLIKVAMQVAPITYYLGYIIGSAIPMVVTQFQFDKDKQEETVSRIRGWGKKRIVLAVLGTIVVAAITIYFFTTGQ